MTKQSNECSKDIEAKAAFDKAKRAFIREIMQTYNVPIDLVRYDTLTDSGDHGGMVDGIE